LIDNIIKVPLNETPIEKIIVNTIIIVRFVNLDFMAFDKLGIDEFCEGVDVVLKSHGVTRR
jgi:hypothetical protein